MSDQQKPFDLILRGGHVIDPAQGLDGIMDVAVRDGRIAAVGKRHRRPGEGGGRRAPASWCCRA